MVFGGGGAAAATAAMNGYYAKQITYHLGFFQLRLPSRFGGNRKVVVTRNNGRAKQRKWKK